LALWGGHSECWIFGFWRERERGGKTPLGRLLVLEVSLAADLHRHARSQLLLEVQSQLDGVGILEFLNKKIKKGNDSDPRFIDLQ